MGLLADAMADEPFCRALVEAIGKKRVLRCPPKGACVRCTPGRPALMPHVVGVTVLGGPRSACSV